VAQHAVVAQGGEDAAEASAVGYTVAKHAEVFEALLYLVEIFAIGFNAFMNKVVVDVKNVYAGIFQLKAEERIFVPILFEFFVEPDFFKHGFIHQHIEG
jgi:hypothetical protein